MPKHDFWIPFVPAWRKSLTVVAIQSGFRKTGIFPVNRNVIKISDLGLSGATDNLANLQGNDRKARIVFQNDVHFVINCLISCRVFVLIVQFPVVFWRQVMTLLIYMFRFCFSGRTVVLVKCRISSLVVLNFVYYS